MQMALTDTIFNVLTFLAAFFYIAGAATIAFDLALNEPRPKQRRIVLTTGVIAIFFHFLLSLHNVSSSGIIAYDLLNMLSLVFLVISALFIGSAFNKPIETLAIIIFPFSAAAVLANINTAIPLATDTALDWSIQTHIMLSVLSYSLLTVAAFQAVMLSIQENHLHARQPGRFINTLPPLQIMEKLLFQTLGLGILLLTFALLSGFIFIEDIFAQHLVHKTGLSILAWIVFATLLWGRSHFGWRGQKAIKWVYSGYISLMLAYFGSKFVFQLILN